jgi:tetratricopeptide (TPR) repeat protein
MIHPIHTEVVSNIKSRDEILCMLGFIASLYFLIRWYKNESALYLVFSVLCYGMALFSKETALAMVLIFPLTMFYMGFRKAKIVMGSLIYLIPLVFYLSVRLMVLGFDGDAPSISVLDNFLVSHTGFLDRFPTVLMLLGKYLGLFVFPYTLVSDYSFNQIQSVGLSDLGFWISFILYIYMFYYIVRNISRKDPMVFGLLFYLISILTYSNLFVLIGSSFAERFLFIPSLGLSICVVFLAYKLIQISKPKSPRWIGAFRYLIVLLFILLAVQTVLRSREWKDPLTLAGTDVRKSPESARLHASYGFALRDYARTLQHRVASDSTNRMALEHFEQAIRIYPNYSSAHAQAGLIHYVLQDTGQALVHYRLALSLAPESAETWCNLGIIYVDRKDYDSAIIVYKKSITYNPRFVDSYLNLGSVMGQMGKFEEALPYFQKALAYDPVNLKALQMISLTYSLLGNKPLAAYWKNQMISVQSKYQP